MEMFPLINVNYHHLIAGQCLRSVAGVFTHVYTLANNLEHPWTMSYPVISLFSINYRTFSLLVYLFIKYIFLNSTNITTLEPMP